MASRFSAGEVNESLTGARTVCPCRSITHVIPVSRRQRVRVRITAQGFQRSGDRETFRVLPLARSMRNMSELSKVYRVYSFDIERNAVSAEFVKAASDEEAVASTKE